LLFLQVRYLWTSPDWTAIPADYTRKDLILPAPVSAVIGSTYTVRLVAGFTGLISRVNSTISVTVKALGPPLVAQLSGPKGEIPQTRTIHLRATGSQDPAEPSAPLSYRWECVRADFPVPCFSGNERGTQSGDTWTIPGGLLGAGVAHTFTVTVTRDTRSASQQLVVTPRQGAVPTGSIVRLCTGAACNQPHNTNQPLSVSLRLQGSNAQDITWQWQVPGWAGAASVTGADLTIPAAQLPASGSVVVNAALQNDKDGTTGSTSTTVPLNAQPSCSTAGASGCVVITTQNSVFPTASFQVAAMGFSDDSGSLR
jgi:hypothetical protein